MQNHLFYQKIKKNISARKNYICLGLDPDLNKLPVKYPQNIQGLTDFLINAIEDTKDLVICYKPNISFFEALGIDGLKLLEKICQIIPDNVPIILDAKRGDIGNTSKCQAKYIFDYFKADAITLHPYMGLDSLSPFFEYQDKFCFVLALTSNPGAGDFEKQTLANNKPLYSLVVERCAVWHQQYQNIGLVVGGTQKELGELRNINSDLLFLIPGVGAQGGDYQNSVNLGKNKDDLAIVNISRGILYSDLGFRKAFESFLAN
ncbi:MAG: orotidine-5'-phosphate decarboxylase [Candidatus Margulisiibacteriota bacterium]|jgi:orotidine-5'-phosphate decarboxylase